MAILTLTTQEQQILVDMLDAAIPDLREEIWHTDEHDYRERLKERENVFTVLRQKLQTDQ